MSEMPSTAFARGGRVRGRGRGRGRGTVSDVLPPPPDPVDLVGAATASRPTHSSANASDPSGSNAPAKFKPRMVKRVAKTEAIDLDLPDQSSTRGGRGRGRGRGAERGGRGRGDIVMTASGAFAMGPAEASRSGRMPQGPTRSGMRKVDNSVIPGEGSSRGYSETVTPWDGGPSEMFDLYSDVEDADGDGEGMIGEGGQVDRAKVADLNDISAEHAMAPLTLPWDPKRIAERERLMNEREVKLSKLASLKLKQEEEKSTLEGLTSRLASDAPSSHEASTGPSGTTTPGFTRASTCTVSESIVKSESVEEQDVEALKAEVQLKREQMEEMAKVGSLIGPSIDATDSSSKDTVPLYIFQFPRQFPKFRNAADIIADPVAEAVDEKPAVPARRQLLKKKKPQVDDWAGWGKGGRRDECPGVPIGEEQKPVEGQIGELIIRRSGRVQMLIGEVAYDVLPAAQATFHQEVAVLDPKPESNLRAMFVLGPTNKKFIVAPDVSSLLERDERERKAKSEQTPVTVS
ncbi:hypothetical protein CROQUDRAFT_667712 [Cronartium quercuum f. sp. fusiforme G11]|uniref:RNA polymerase III RPC4 n=1 Tax=Cronartium quercuum f. sp. fusiforme G11 TaxID=708437 RepID=A0A9P6NWI1_9BASI|nr:hypothetical protein CROQUDRAFT_667712 [Cronartium quercuum f. sp. fusiforme G11]